MTAGSLKAKSAYAVMQAQSKHRKPIDANRRLDAELRIKTAGTHLYRYGVIFFKTCNIERKFYFNPYFILCMEMLYLVRSIASMAVPAADHYRTYFVYSGDFMYFLHAKMHINLAATQYMMIGISILIMNFARYVQHNYPHFLRCFEFLAGHTRPAAADLYNPRYILSLLTKSRLMINTTHVNTRVVFLVSFVLCAVPFSVNFTAGELLLIGLPWSFIFAIASFYTFSAYFWNMAYFYILCQLVKYRLRETNDCIAASIRNARHFRRYNLAIIKKRLETIQREVKLYNDTYWALYLFLVVALMSTFNNAVFYAAIYVKMNIVMQASLFYATALSSVAIYFILQTASVVHYEAAQSRKLLNRLYVAVQGTLDYRSLYKLNLLIEGITRKQICFYFYNMFRIDYFKFVEIVLVIVAYFLKITDMSMRGLL